MLVGSSTRGPGLPPVIIPRKLDPFRHITCEFWSTNVAKLNTQLAARRGRPDLARWLSRVLNELPLRVSWNLSEHLIVDTHPFFPLFLPVYTRKPRPSPLPLSARLPHGGRLFST